MSTASKPAAAEPVVVEDIAATRHLLPSAHLDTFARDNLPPRNLWPHLKFDRPELQYAQRLNCADALLSRAAASSSAAEPRLYYKDTIWSHEMLLVTANQIASVLAEDLGLVPGNRVLLRGANTPWLLAAWLGTIKAGGVAVTTMPLLRAAELIQIIDRAKVDFAICEDRLVGELVLARGRDGSLRQIVTFAQGSGELEQRCPAKARSFHSVATAQDDVALIAFTSGTTGHPKATMHFHRDVMATCDTFARHILRSRSDEIFTGTPPLGFTFGLGALLAFPLSAGAAIALPDQTSPEGLLKAIAQHGATTCFTSPSCYRAMLALLSQHDVRTLRKCVAAGEYLSAATSDAWFEATGLRLIDGIGATEMLHIFISAAGDDVRPGATGKPVPGYEACLLDERGRPIDGPGSGHLAVRGPTGCRYLADARQSAYVVDGWNVTSDCYRRDSDGYYWFVARTDDMIVSSGYNIAAPEVERALLEHAAVADVAVVASPDKERGSVVKAFIVLRAGFAGEASLRGELQNFVKARIAPYKYPRLIEFVESLPQTATGKLKRHVLRQPADADTDTTS